MPDPAVDAAGPEPATLWRRLAAGLYDLLPTLAIFMSLGFFVTAARRFEPVPPGSVWFELLLLGAALVYYGASWVHGGQTLGMRAWRLRVQRRDGHALGWSGASLRFALAVLGIAALGAGLLWALIDTRRRMWHDLAADSEVILVPRPRAPRAPDRASS
jgi:uncharacterized RDD family membrane protein YckC